MVIRCLSRPTIDVEAWNRCVNFSSERIVYAYTWYLDAVTSLPDWRWDGLILLDADGRYEAVMPVPLRRKYGVWVVHQPLFCQFLGIYGAKLIPDIQHAFAQKLLKEYGYGSILHLRTIPSSAFSFSPSSSHCQTYLLDLSRPYDTIFRQYKPDTRRHLRQAQGANWTILVSNDVVPLLNLFRRHHASRIPGGVGEWAHGLFEGLFTALQERGAGTLWYAVRAGEIEAGAVFVQHDNRIIYLFNAASETGRRQHARTLLIDRMIRQQAGQAGVVFDFESPDEASIADFYRHFGAVESPYWRVRWNQLPRWFSWIVLVRQRLVKSRRRF